MAKAGIILRGARGKIGDIVAQKGSRGGTIIRERVTPKSSKSRRATAQKVIFTTVTQAAAAMASLVDHSFQGYSAEMSRQEFVRTNLNTMRALAANDFATEATPQTASVFMTTKNMGVIVPNAYTVSKGSLTNNSPFKVYDSAAEKLMFQLPTIAFPAIVGEHGTAGTFKGSDFLNALGFNTPFDQLTFVQIFIDQQDPVYTFSAPTSGNRIFASAFQADRLVPNAAAFDTTFNVEAGSSLALTIKLSLSSFFDIEKSSEGAIALMEALLTAASSTFEDNTAELKWTATDAAALDYRYNSSYNSVAAGIIKSRSVGKNWLRSTTTLHIDQNGPSGLIWRYAVDAWLEGTEVENNEQYLDEGGDENTI